MGGAIFDQTGRYRYSLWREWKPEGARVTFVMLNPSTADAEHNDPTIHRCVQFAQLWGFGSLEVVNLFAYRTPSPTVLRQASDPIGVDNDRYILAAANRSERLVLAWGNWGALQGRDRAILNLLDSYSNLYCFKRNRSGQPCHPLYIHHDTVLVPFP